MQFRGQVCRYGAVFGVLVLLSLVRLLATSAESIASPDPTPGSRRVAVPASDESPVRDEEAGPLQPAAEPPLKVPSFDFDANRRDFQFAVACDGDPVAGKHILLTVDYGPMHSLFSCYLTDLHGHFRANLPRLDRAAGLTLEYAGSWVRIDSPAEGTDGVIDVELSSPDLAIPIHCGTQDLAGVGVRVVDRYRESQVVELSRGGTLRIHDARLPARVYVPVVSIGERGVGLGSIRKLVTPGAREVELQPRTDVRVLRIQSAFPPDEPVGRVLYVQRDGRWSKGIVNIPGSSLLLEDHEALEAVLFREARPGEVCWGYWNGDGACLELKEPEIRNLFITGSGSFDAERMYLRLPGLERHSGGVEASLYSGVSNLGSTLSRDMANGEDFGTLRVWKGLPIRTIDVVARSGVHSVEIGSRQLVSRFQHRNVATLQGEAFQRSTWISEMLPRCVGGSPESGQRVVLPMADGSFLLDLGEDQTMDSWRVELPGGVIETAPLRVGEYRQLGVGDDE